MVGKELHLLLNYEEIKNSPLLSRFLEFVVEKKLSGRDEEIKEYTIGVKALGKPKDFNPQLDASVRIHAGRLRKILQDYYSGPGRDDTVHIDIPKGTYIPVFENRLTNTRHKTVVTSNTPKQEEKTKTAILHPGPKPILAVLPFHNLSSDNSKDFFVKGIGEQLSTDFARFQNISVISYYSIDKYEIDLHDLQQMKKLLNIDYALTGSVRFINDLIRLNVQLIKVENGQIIFADTYTKQLTVENIFEVQEDITTEILDVVAGDHGVIVNDQIRSAARVDQNFDVKEAVFTYFDYTSEFENEKYSTTITVLEKAVAVDPHNALALSLLASMYMYGYCTKKENDEALLERSLDLSITAVHSDPNCQHALQAMAWALQLSGKKEKSLELIERCIRLNPKATSVIALMALAYVCQGEYAEGLRWLNETKHLSPTVPGAAKFGYCLYYFNKGDYEESLHWLDRLGPVHTALFLLIRIALNGQIHKSKIPVNPGEFEKINNIQSIVGRMVLDPALRSKILEGLSLAGLTVK